MKETRSEFDQYTDKLLDSLKVRQRKEQLALIERRADKRKVVQKGCNHPYTFTELDENYHTGETWKETYCGVCGKLISRI